MANTESSGHKAGLDALPAIVVFYKAGRINDDFSQKVRTRIPVPKVHHVCQVSQLQLLFIRIHTYFILSMGLRPQWKIKPGPSP